MLRKRLFVFLSLVIVSGCLWPVREKTDREVGLQIAHPFDVAPEQVTTVRYTGASKDNVTETPAVSSTTPATHSFPSIDVETTSFMQATEPARPAAPPHLDLKIPGELPGAEAPLIQFPKDRAAKDAEIRRIYPALPALPEEPKALPGPDGHPYTLSELQRIAAENSPTLRQAASDVEAAKGNVIAARAYPNPTVGLENDPSNNGSTAGVYGMFVDQPIKTGGKLKLQSASAEMDLANAELALRRARSDLSTGVRNAYYGLVVAQETVRVNRSLARFTDEIYRLQAQLLEGGFAAAYEPAALRAQAYTARLAYKQSIASYVYAWKQLVSTVGLRQLPLSEVAGRVDRLIPAFEYDSALARVLQSHTDVLTARNAVEKARYNLKLQQVTPVPDVDVRLAVLKETAIAPFNWVTTAQIGVPLPIWDQNKGPIIAAQAALERASEEPHRVETNITNNFAAAFVNYKNNLDALDYYRRYILPDQVRAYRGVYERRQIDPNSAFGDLVQAQQTLAADVATYLGLLGQLWTSVVTVADFLQTDDLFQQARPLELPPLPDLGHLPAWPCPHPLQAGASCAPPASVPPSHVALTPPGSGVPVLRPVNVVSVRAPAPKQPDSKEVDELLLLPPPPVVRPPAAPPSGSGS